MSFQVLFVCTGNVCRSPMAERLFIAGLAPEADLTVRSAGVQALVEEGIDASSAQALTELGVNPGGHRAMQLTSRMILDADLLLAATRAHRDLLLTMVPTALRRTFTMKEFARLTHDAPAGAPNQAVSFAAARRGLVAPPPGTGDDVGDPFGGRVQDARRTAYEIARAVEQTLRALGVDRAGPSGATSANIGGTHIREQGP